MVRTLIPVKFYQINTDDTRIDKFSGESFPQEDGFMKIIRNEPLGVCASVIPWNGPLGNIGELTIKRHTSAITDLA